MTSTQAQIIRAPAQEPITHNHSVFLAGTTTQPEWREDVIASLSDQEITIFDPLRPDWDSSWIEDETFAPFREQVEWELEMQRKAHLVVIYFGPDTDAPISLLEFGLAVRQGKALVVCHPAYRKKGNVQIICRNYGIAMRDSLNGLAKAVMDELHKPAVT
jgi:hypothetical protein